jgi:hypothetical protein
MHDVPLQTSLHEIINYRLSEQAKGDFHVETSSHFIFVGGFHFDERFDRRCPG